MVAKSKQKAMFLRPSVHKTSNFCIDALLGLSQPCSRCFLLFVSALLPSFSSFSSLPHIFSSNPFFFSLLPVVPSVFCSRCSDSAPVVSSSLLSNPFLPSCLSGFGCGARHHRGQGTTAAQGTIAGKAPPRASAPASGSQQAAQLSQRAAPPAECHDRRSTSIVESFNKRASSFSLRVKNWPKRDTEGSILPF